MIILKTITVIFKGVVPNDTKMGINLNRLCADLGNGSIFLCRSRNTIIRNGGVRDISAWQYLNRAIISALCKIPMTTEQSAS